MTCALRSPSFAAVLLAIATLSLAPARPLGAQPPPPPPRPLPAPLPSGAPVAGTAIGAPYRAPVIAMVQPPGVSTMGTVAGGSVPQDKPVVVFRFAAGEPDDPLDLRSLLVAVDGVDRTALFQSATSGTAFQAWGPLADPVTLARGAFATGLHRVTARICSSRGACGVTDAQVVVLPVSGLVSSAASATAPPASDSTRRGLRRRVLDLAVGAARKLLVP